MEKSRWNYWIDIALLVAFIIVAVSGLILYFAFISGEQGKGQAVRFMGTSKSTWQPWHNYSGLAMVVLVLVHLIFSPSFI